MAGAAARSWHSQWSPRTVQPARQNQQQPARPACHLQCSLRPASSAVKPLSAAQHVQHTPAIRCALQCSCMLDRDESHKAISAVLLIACQLLKYMREHLPEFPQPDAMQHTWHPHVVLGVHVLCQRATHLLPTAKLSVMHDQHSSA